MRKYWIIFLIVIFAAASLTACNQNNEPPAAPTTSRTIIDQGGNEVLLPDKIERVVITTIYALPSVFVQYKGSADQLIGMHPASLSAARYSLLPELFPAILDVETGFIQGGIINVEELLKLNPDVVFYSTAYPAEKEVLQKAGIPSVGFSNSINDFNAVETVNSWLEQLAEVFGEPERVPEITGYARNVEAEIAARLKDLPEAKKPRALFLFRYSNTEIRTSGSNFFGEYWSQATGAVNVAAELNGVADINMEQVYAWNPDIIYITHFSPFMPEDLFTNQAVPGHNWSGVKAVQEGRVYKLPLGLFGWFPPSAEAALSLWFQAKNNHPELFSDLDLPQIVRDYYKNFFQVDLTDEQLARIFYPAREAAGGV